MPSASPLLAVPHSQPFTDLTLDEQLALLDPSVGPFLSISATRDLSWKLNTLADGQHEVAELRRRLDTVEHAAAEIRREVQTREVHAASRIAALETQLRALGEGLRGLRRREPGGQRALDDEVAQRVSTLTALRQRLVMGTPGAGAGAGAGTMMVRPAAVQQLELERLLDPDATSEPACDGETGGCASMHPLTLCFKEPSIEKSYASKDYSDAYYTTMIFAAMQFVITSVGGVLLVPEFAPLTYLRLLILAVFMCARCRLQTGQGDRDARAMMTVQFCLGLVWIVGASAIVFHGDMPWGKAPPTTAVYIALLLLTHGSRLRQMGLDTKMRLVNTYGCLLLYGLMVALPSGWCFTVLGPMRELVFFSCSLFMGECVAYNLEAPRRIDWRRDVWNRR